MKFWLLIFWIWKMFQLQFMIKNERSTFCHYPWHSTVSQSCAICSQMPKCADLAQTRTNAYDMRLSNRPINLRVLSRIRCANIHFEFSIKILKLPPTVVIICSFFCDELEICVSFVKAEDSSVFPLEVESARVDHDRSDAPKLLLNRQTNRQIISRQKPLYYW